MSTPMVVSSNSGAAPGFNKQGASTSRMRVQQPGSIDKERIPPPLGTGTEYMYMLPVFKYPIDNILLNNVPPLTDTG